MTSTNISRDEAAERSDGLRLSTVRTVLDLRRADDQQDTGFGVRTVIELESELEETFLDFVGTEVTALLVNDEEQDVDFDGARLALRLVRGHNVVEVEAEGEYSRSGQGLHRFQDPVDQRTYLYTQFEPADARRVFPCFEQPDLKARHEVVVLAPEGWTVRGNGRELRHEEVEDGVRHEFAATEPLSSYLVAVAAGEWHEVTGHWDSGDGLEVELGVLCRQSLVDRLDADAILEVTRQGLGFYHRDFGFAYPWGKYDQVFVPEYNLGAMENPGLVTFTEAYLPRSAATRNQYQQRANTILHEMAHMWFGDLVTPAWWDDLWLKESFAEYMGAHASVAVTEFDDAWVAFAGRRKSWAYSQDQLPTTHPIVADIGDVEAAKQNFDGITYAKGASVLKQLVAHVGVDDFFAGARAYFQQHAFGSARLSDLLAALEKTSGRDLTSWSRLWLETAGPDELSPVVELDGDRIARLGVQQVSLDARDGSTVGRPHTLRVGLYRRQGDELVRAEQFEVELDGSDTTWVEEAEGLAAPDLVLVNDDDLTYAKADLDDASLATVLADLSRVSDPLARALCWSSLWNMVRDARLRVDDYLAAVAAHAPAEPDPATLTDVVGNAVFAINRYLPEAAQQQAAASFGEQLWRALGEAAAGSDAQLVLARACAQLATRDRALAEHAAALLEGSEQVDGLELGPDLRWQFAHALAAQGLWGKEQLDQELKSDPSNDGMAAYQGSIAAQPEREEKEEAWRRLHVPRSISNDHVDALVHGFAVPGQAELVAPWAGEYFETLEQVWQEHAIEIAGRLVQGLFPATDDAQQRGEAWLEAHPDAPGALRRLVLEGTDQAARAARAREFNG